MKRYIILLFIFLFFNLFAASPSFQQLTNPPGLNFCGSFRGNGSGLTNVPSATNAYIANFSTNGTPLGIMGDVNGSLTPLISDPGMTATNFLYVGMGHTTNSTEKYSVAFGDFTLIQGSANNDTAIGYAAMQGPCSGGANTVVGFAALQNGGTSRGNVCVGEDTLQFNVGNWNTVVGSDIYLASTVTNVSNATIVGASSFGGTGPYGSGTVSVGYHNFTSQATNGPNNIYLGNNFGLGIQSDSYTMRLGGAGTSIVTNTFIAGNIHGNALSMTNYQGTNINGTVPSAALINGDTNNIPYITYPWANITNFGGAMTIITNANTSQTAFTIQLKTINNGTGANSNICDVNFPKPFVNPPMVMMSSVNCTNETLLASGALEVHVDYTSVTTSNFSIISGNSSLAGGTTNTWNVLCIGK